MILFWSHTIACAIAHTHLPDTRLDVAIFSLSLMGLNYADYLQEAHRTLKGGGSLLIAETISRWTDKKRELLDLITNLGFIIVKEQESDHFLYINATKPLIAVIWIVLILAISQAIAKLSILLS